MLFFVRFEMCAVKWDMIKTIGDEEIVEDIESDSDVEVEVNLYIKNTFKLRNLYHQMVFSINQKNIKPRVIHTLTMNLSFCPWLQSITMTHGMICKNILNVKELIKLMKKLKNLGDM